jgi:hypothetical protein
MDIDVPAAHTPLSADVAGNHSEVVDQRADQRARPD